MSKPQTVNPDRLTWQTPEWADKGSEALVAYANGYELEIGPNPEKKGDWDWVLKATVEISETPEVIDSGDAKSPGGARWNASHAANRHQRQMAKAKAKPVEAQVAAEVKVKPKKAAAKQQVAA